MPKKKTCGGAGCRRFILPYSPKEFEEQYRAWLVGHRGSTGSMVLTKRCDAAGDRGFGLARHYLEEIVKVDPEIHIIFPMLIYLGYCDFNPCNPRKKLEMKSHHYTCKHYDKKTTLCTIYEHRPLMCRRYPNGEPCPFPNCEIPGNKKRLQEQRKREKHQMRATEKLLKEDVVKKKRSKNANTKRDTQL